MRSKGLHYEELAYKHLSKFGLKLINKNFSCRRGEIDLIMKDNSTLVFVEVRYRKYESYGSALESVNLKKQQKIANAASFYLSKHNLWHYDCRFDVVAITDKTSILKKPNIEWLKSAFQLHG